MPRVIVESGDAQPVRTVPTDTSRWFFADFAQRGDHTQPIFIGSPAQAAGLIGSRVTYSLARSAIDVAGSAYFARVVGPNPVYASVNVTATGTTHTITAREVGDWANGSTGGVTVDIIQGPIGGANFRVYVIKFNGTEVERTPEFDVNSRQAVVDWSVGSDYVTITLGAGSGIPTVASGVNLAGGNDDHANAVDAQWAAAINRFPADLGPGQLTMLGRTTNQAYIDTLAAAAASNRKAILDGANTASKATLKSAAATLRANINADEGSLYAPWVTYPGVGATGTRTIPPSAFVAAAYARNDAIYGADQPAAGDWGVLAGAIGLAATGTLTADDYDDLNNAGVNMLRSVYGVLQIMGARTLADPAVQPTRWQASNGRLDMLIKARCAEIGQKFEFRKIDGQGFAMADWHGQLSTMMNRLFVAGDLYPDPDDPRPETAFRVDTATPNTALTLQAGQFLADIYYVPAPFAEMVKMTVYSVPIGTPLAA